MAVRIVSAGAGTGKTHRLGEELLAAIEGGVRPEGVVAITYTRKAAAELEGRLRQRLLEGGRGELAARLRDGYLGTIHSICERLLREFALEAGLSPELAPLPESEADTLLARAVAQVESGRLGKLAHRLSMEGKDARETLGKLLDAARSNGLDDLSESAKRSEETLRALLSPLRRMDRAAFRAALERELAKIEPKLAADAGSNGAAKERADRVSTLLASVRRDLPPWLEIVRVSRKLGEVKKLEPLAGAFCQLANGHVELSCFQDELVHSLRELFEVAGAALTAVKRAKDAERVVDFGDMLASAREILRMEEVRRSLAERLDLVLVDEFQDVSPLQLAIVSELAALAKRTVWVGDRKQAIFAFQGSDPELMESAMANALRGAPPELLGTSHRSRPPLVELVSDVFAPAFASHGLPEAQVRLAPAARDPRALAGQPVLELWRWGGGAPKGSKPSEAQAIAEGIVDLLARGPLVRSRGDGGAVRAVTPSDVGVLCRRNDRCREVAAALRARGIPARVQLGGLLSTPEAKLAVAALALVADPEDGVAALELSWLGGAGAGDPDGWLARRFEEAERARGAGDRPPPPFGDDPRVRALRELHERARRASPSEALDRAIREIDLPALLRRWPEPERRLGNLEALRGLARGYEELCRSRREACTASGLLVHLAGVREAEKDAQADAAEAEAVTVLTWHKAKGLEWPVTIVSELDKEWSPDVFGVQVEGAERFDATDPLAGRWIRYWPWPYGGVSTDLRLLDAALQTPEARRLLAKDERERLRLLYVALTRARDLLVLVAGEKKGAPLLDPLREIDGRPLLSLPLAAPPGDAEATVGERRWPCPVRAYLGLPPAERRAAPLDPRWYAAGPRLERPVETLNPSGEPWPEPESFSVRASADLGGRLSLQAAPSSMEALGEAVHGFLAADPFEGEERRVEIARRLLDAHGVLGAIDPATLLRASDRLRDALKARWPKATWRREWPVRARLEGRLLVGQIDLLLELPDGFAVVDHKSFPGAAAEAEAERRAVEHAPQLAWYAKALEAALSKPPLALLIHLPLAGRLVEIERQRASAAQPGVSAS